MRAHNEDRASTLGLVRDDDCEFTAARLSRADESDGRFTVATGRVEDQMQVLAWVGACEQFLEQRDAERKIASIITIKRQPNCASYARMSSWRAYRSACWA